MKGRENEFEEEHAPAIPVPPVAWGGCKRNTAHRVVGCCAVGGVSEAFASLRLAAGERASTTSKHHVRTFGKPLNPTNPTTRKRTEFMASIVLLLFLLLGVVLGSSHAFQPPPQPPGPSLDRQSALVKDAAALLPFLGAALAWGPLQAPQPAVAAKHTVDYSAFKKSLFQVPPKELTYPAWMEGEWNTKAKFIAADFPSSSSTKASPYVPKDKIVNDVGLPGFKRLSICMVPDVGKDHAFRMRFARAENEAGASVKEDKAFNLKQSLESELGKAAVVSIDYAPGKNPNRASLALLPNVSPNAQRIELFWNARAPLPALPGEAGAGQPPSFRYYEDIRQVNLTPSLAETSTVGDFRHVWEFYQEGPDTLQAYLSTVAFATPQDPLFQTAGLAPLVVYFHILALTRAEPATATREGEGK